MIVTNKQILWDILCKYDNILEFRYFCDSISRILQGTNDINDLLDIIKFNEEIDNSDIEAIDEIVNLKEIVF